jgi:hypothetical protein
VNPQGNLVNAERVLVLNLPEPNPMRIAIDSGGTFTDCVYLENGEICVVKLFSTPEDPARAVLQCVAQALRSGSASFTLLLQLHVISNQRGSPTYSCDYRSI